jgi:hypothetical protein
VATAVALPEEAPESFASWVPGTVGDPSNRAFWRGPDDLEGALGFFRIDCFGGGFDDDDRTSERGSP